MISGATLTDEIYNVLTTQPDNIFLASINENGLEIMLWPERMPVDVVREIKDEANANHTGAKSSALEMIVEVEEVSAELTTHLRKMRIRKQTCPTKGPLSWYNVRKAFIMQHFGYKYENNFSSYLDCEKIVEIFLEYDSSECTDNSPTMKAWMQTWEVRCEFFEITWPNSLVIKVTLQCLETLISSYQATIEKKWLTHINIRVLERIVPTTGPDGTVLPPYFDKDKLAAQVKRLRTPVGQANPANKAKEQKKDAAKQEAKEKRQGAASASKKEKASAGKKRTRGRSVSELSDARRKKEKDPPITKQPSAQAEQRKKDKLISQVSKKKIEDTLGSCDFFT